MSDRRLDRLTSKLGRCLSRIDDHASRLFSGREEDDPELLQQLDREAGQLQELIAAIATRTESDAQRSDLDRAVARSVRALLGETTFPLVVREHLAGDLAPADCSPALLEQAVQRAFSLAADHAGSGGEIDVETNAVDDGLVLELRCRGHGSPHLQQRALTLREFVAEMHGRCAVDIDDAGGLRLALELPAVLEPDGRKPQD